MKRRPRTAARVPAAAVPVRVPAGVLAADLEVLKVEVHAGPSWDASATISAEVGTDGGWSLEVGSHRFTVEGVGEHTASFYCDTPDAIRALAGALLGAIDAAERAGILPRVPA